MTELFIPLGLGLTGDEQVQRGDLGEEAVNLYPDLDGAGYLVNYPGREDHFVRPGGVLHGTPPAQTGITRIITFRDTRGWEHVVFVQGATICVKRGNGFRVMYTLKGRNIDGAYYPALFIHEAKLIILNFGDVPLMWDGKTNVHSLGVQETPSPPDVRVSTVPYSTRRIAFTQPTSHSHGVWQFESQWWPGTPPSNGPGANKGADGETDVAGIYDCAVQYQDEYGNKSRPSPPCPTFEVPANTDAGGVSTTEIVRYYANADWMPPQIEDHITGVLFGRTLSLNPDGGLGVRGVYYVESNRLDTTFSRLTMRASDTTLTAWGLMDVDVIPPPQSSIGCSFRRRIFFAGLEDPNIVMWTDVDLFGQCRAINQYRAHDHVKALVPMDDRVAIITRSSTEVLYESEAGMAILGQDWANGSYYGRSYVDMGDGSCFGLWNKGFGFYDGQKHTYVPTPYYVQALYNDSRFFVHSAVKTSEWYIITIRKDIVSTANNHLLMFHFTSGRWYLLQESVNDLCVWKDGFLGVDDSIYQLFRGRHPNAAVLHIHGFMPTGANPTKQIAISEFRLFMEPSSSDLTTFEIEGALVEDVLSEGQTHTLASQHGPSRDAFKTVHWHEKFKYSGDHKWSVPQDIWVKPGMSKTVTAYSHSFRITFPAGHPIRIKGLGVMYTSAERQP